MTGRDAPTKSVAAFLWVCAEPEVVQRGGNEEGVAAVVGHDGEDGAELLRRGRVAGGAARKHEGAVGTGDGSDLGPLGGGLRSGGLRVVRRVVAARRIG